MSYDFSETVWYYKDFCYMGFWEDCSKQKLFSWLNYEKTELILKDRHSIRLENTVKEQFCNLSYTSFVIMGGEIRTLLAAA